MNAYVELAVEITLFVGGGLGISILAHAVLRWLREDLRHTRALLDLVEQRAAKRLDALETARDDDRPTLRDADPPRDSRVVRVNAPGPSGRPS